MGCSLRSADVFPVVASLPWRKRSDDRKYVCASQARLKVSGAMKVLGLKKVCPFVSNLEIFYIYYHLDPCLLDSEF